jgi:hypothetical protein
MLQVIKSLEYGSKAYWDSVFAESDSVQARHNRWRDSMEALEETPYVIQKELFATDAQYYIIPAAFVILILLVIFGILLYFDSRKADKEKSNNINSILDYNEKKDRKIF